MTTQPPDLNKLREVAESATPGPWSRLSGKLRPQFSLRINEIRGPYDECLIRWNGFDGVDTNKRQTDANAKFIATFNPQTILALLDAYEASARDAELWRYIVRENNKGMHGRFRIVWFDEREALCTMDGTSVDGKDDEAIVRYVEAARHATQGD